MSNVEFDTYKFCKDCERTINITKPIMRYDLVDNNGWHVVSDGDLPNDAVEVFVTVETNDVKSNKKLITGCVAFYVSEHSITAEDLWGESDISCDTYYEAEDKYYVAKGWYEVCGRFSGEYWHIDSIDGSVVAWRNLPKLWEGEKHGEIS